MWRRLAGLAAVTGSIAALAGAAAAAPVPGGALDACALLTDQEIQVVQPSAIEERRRSEESSGQLRFLQCFFKTARFEHSVSLTVITRAETGVDDAVSSYWERTFVRPAKQSVRRPAPGRQPKEKRPPRPIEGAGGDAFWTGDDRAGALYVIAGDVIVRISVGGVQDEEVRIARSRSLARAAVQRLVDPAE